MKLKQSKAKLAMIFLTFLMLASSLLASFTPVQSVEASQSPTMKVVCKFEDGQTLANLQATDYLYYLTRSKSAVANTDSVEGSWLNKMLSVAGFDFVTPNETILGREIKPTTIPEEQPKVNQGPKVSAFDRFGMAGLNWSSYQGEWKYYQVNACASQGQVSPNNYGSFYDKRVEPKTTYNEVSTSKDARTIQFNRGLFSIIFASARDLVANMMFFITKLIVTLTIVFVGLAFTDITSLIGMSSDGSAGLSSTGMFTDIFNTIFSGFILFTFLFTAIYLLYNGLVKRQIRMAMGTLIKTIIIFIAAIIMASNPAQWISAPNKIATYGQALVLSSMAGLYENDTDQPSLCSTEVASIYEGVNIGANKTEKALSSDFEKLNRNMKSLIGCQMWEQLLFRPWVKGQFGYEYEELNANKIKNINSDWVGTASVPLGNEKTLDNWALFHLSTQTDAHAQVGESNFPVLVNGVNADWWRTVDALSNYNEEEQVTSDGQGGEETFMEPVDSNPTKFWQSWVGNNSIERMGTAFIAITFGIVGSIAPLIFSFSSALYGLAITIMMVTSPVFLLLGTWGGRGDKIFIGWLSTLANLVIKRIGVSILLILSLTLTLNMMKLAYTVGIIKSFILMVLVTYVLIKNKGKLLDLMASVDFGGAFDPRTQANKFLNTQSKNAKNVGNVGVAALSGGIAGVKSGQGFSRGANIASKNQIRNTLYQNPMGVQIAMQADLTSDKSNGKRHNCMICYKQLGNEGKELVYRDEDGNYYCEDCGEELGVETLFEVMLGDNQPENYVAAESLSPLVERNDVRTKTVTGNRSYLSHSKTRELMKSRIQGDNYYWDNNGVQNMIKDNIERLREDTVIFTNLGSIYGSISRPPAPPEPLQNYIDIALINQAWTSGDVEAVERTYKAAWQAWYEDNGQHVEGLSIEDIEKFKKEIEDFSPDIDIERTKDLMNEQMTKAEREKNKFEDEDMYIHINGKLRLNIYDNIKKRSKEHEEKDSSPEAIEKPKGESEDKGPLMSKERDRFIKKDDDGKGND